MDDSQDFPYRAEYAKSGRSSCKFCKTPIAKDSLRLAVMVQSPMFDGKVPHWYHSQCFFSKQKPKSVEDIAHFDGLRWEDQEKITKRLEAAKNEPTTSKKGRKKAGDSSKSSLFMVDMAKSGRAACKECEQKILKAEIRIAKMDYESEKARRFGGMPRWHHVKCFTETRSELEFFGNADTLPGFFTLGEDDRKMLREKLPEIQVKRKIEAEEQPAPKKVKTEDSKKKKQNKKLYACRDSLSKFLKKGLMVDLLLHNDQYVPKGESQVLDHLSDVMTFGALVPCTMCSDGRFIYSYGKGYICKGNISEWTKCTNILQCPQRVPFKIPSDVVDVQFLDTYKFKSNGDRIISVVDTPKADDGVSADNGGPLNGLIFKIIGSNFSKSKASIREEVRKLGGATSSSDVTADVAAIITTKETLGEKNTDIKKAKKLGVQCVPETFLEEVRQGNALFLLKKMDMSHWGSEPGQRIAEAQKSGKVAKKLKSGSMYTKSVPDTMKVKLKDGLAVDPDSGVDDFCHVYRRGSVVYNSVLNYVDVAAGANSYYKLQLLERDNKRGWYVFRSWGRIGTTIGGNKLEEMADLNDAMDHFKELFLEKTGNTFGSKEFVKVTGKMYPLEMEYEQKAKDVKIDLSKSKSSLAKPIQEFVAKIFDVNQMKSTLMEYEIDLKKMPLGKISKRQIEKAYKILGEVQLLLDDGTEDKKDVMDAGKHAAVKAKILDCSNKFYTLIPHDFGVKQPPLLNQHTLVKNKINMLDSLSEIEVAYNLLHNDQSDVKEDQLIDNYYSKLKTEMSVLDKDSEEFNMIHKYVKNTHAQTHSHYSLELQQVFKVNRKGEAKRFKPFRKLSNRQLLWHGSRTTNYAGILSQGLRIAPPEAPVTGYMFGKGIYFADMVSKSANYCCTSATNNVGFLLLCDVALGNMYERTNAEFVEALPAGKHSTKGLGQTCPDPKEDLTLEDGVKVPLGKPVKADVKKSQLLYNEYIVYDVGQVASKYLLQMEFKYNM